MASSENFDCVFCKETFANKEALQIHFRKHGDPNFQQNNKSVQNEVKKTTASPNLGTELVSCDACSEVFPTISKAITHKHKVHPDLDAKYFCPWCGKLFTLKHLYNKHMQSNHDSSVESDVKDFHCDCCDVYFYVASAMLHHNKFFHRQDDLPHIGQSKKQKIYHQELLLVYYCTFCGEEYNNKVNLHKHISDDHSDENQSPDDVLRCSLCDAIFYHLDAYELHLTFHSSEDLYVETNNLNADAYISEYTLETVPPIMEKVEEYECPQQDSDYMRIENFLQLSMDNDAVDTSTSKKSKKQKKHKKSKKAALTIDEFLNMNTDVFGEGLDFQGIEEVPTRVVAKQLKKKPQVSKSDIEKLKKQGIVVKKSGKPLLPQTHKGTNSKPLIKKPATQISENAIKTSSDVLSKLLNQSNNQIKIVKASPKDTVIKQEINGETTPKSTKNEVTPQESTEEKQSEEVLPKPEVKKNCEEVNHSVDANDNSQQTEECSQDSNLKSVSPSSPPETNEKQIEDHPNESDQDKVEEATTEKCSDDNNCAVVSSSDNINNFTDSSHLESKYKNVVGSIKSLQNIGQQVTIKPLFRDTECKTESSATSEVKINKDTHKESDNTIITSNQNKDECYRKPINVLKKLGNITIKTIGTSVKQSDNASANENLSKETEDGRTDQDEEQETDNSSEQNIQDHKITTTKSLDVLKKHLSKLITIKSVPKSCKNNSEDSDDTGDEDKDQHTTTIITEPKAKIENVEIKNKIDDNQTLAKQSALGFKNAKPSIQPVFNEENKISSNEIVKHLKNITPKPIPNNILSLASNITNANLKTLAHSKEIDKDMEIFNIDSDSDDDDTQNSSASQNDFIHTSIEKNIHQKPSQVHTNHIKNISKNIVVKSIVKENSEMSQVYEKRMSNSDEYSMNNESFETNDEDDEQLDTINSKTLLQKEPEVKKALKDVLKNLSKHVTIKSNVTRNPSPSTFKFQDQNSPVSVNNKIDDAENYSDSSPRRVKISEIVTENEDLNENVEDELYDKNVVISSPYDRQNEELDDIDIESAIKNNVVSLTNKLHQNKQLNKPSFNLNNLKNISKDITIKSLNEKETNNDSDDEDGKFKVPMNKSISLHQHQHLNKELTIKSSQPTISETRDENLSNKTNLNVRQMSPSTNQFKNNQRQIALANQQFNTVNNEVTVKTVQTKTFVEEITTTVTRTIRTVNQTVKQEAQSVNQMAYSSGVGLQKNTQTNSPQQRVPIKTFVKQAPSTAQPRFSTPVRPSVGATVKNSNQLVPVRSGLPLRHRNPAPKIPVKQNIIPSMSNQQRPMLGKPLRISPHVTNTAIKRPSNEDSGPFSCFKKPKESLIPVSDVPSATDQARSTVQYSSSQIQANFSNTTKTSKSANSTVTSSTQMTSDVRTSAQQQFSRLNTSGLRVVKSAQQNIATKVEQKSENTSGVSKRTLDAIEMLQKQGLLVKKPRVEVKNDSEQEHTDSENECGNDTQFEEDD